MRQITTPEDQRQSKTICYKKNLRKLNNLGYNSSVLAKSKTRIETLNYHPTATHDALSVFFCVNAYANLSSMVALVGHPQGWLDSVGASSLNPVNVTAKELETSSGDYINHSTEAAKMATTPNKALPKQKLFKFYNSKTAQFIETTATTERQARQNLGNSSLIFVSRKPLFLITNHFNHFGGRRYA